MLADLINIITLTHALQLQWYENQDLITTRCQDSMFTSVTWALTRSNSVRSHYSHLSTGCNGNSPEERGNRQCHRRRQFSYTFFLPRTSVKGTRSICSVWGEGRAWWDRQFITCEMSRRDHHPAHLLERPSGKAREDVKFVIVSWNYELVPPTCQRYAHAYAAHLYDLRALHIYRKVCVWWANELSDKHKVLSYLLLQGPLEFFHHGIDENREIHTGGNVFLQMTCSIPVANNKCNATNGAINNVIAKT